MPQQPAVRQAAADLREHDSGVGIKFLRKPPIGDKGNGVERPVAICERRGVGGAIDGCTKGGLVVMIISASHVHIGNDGIFHARQNTWNCLSPALKAVLLMLVLLIAAQPAQTKSPEMSVKPVLVA